MDPLVGTKKAHVLMVTSSGQSHLDIFLQILHHLSAKYPGIIVTVVCSVEQVPRLDRSRVYFAGLDLRLKDVFGKNMGELRSEDSTWPTGLARAVETDRLLSESTRKELVAQKGTRVAPTCLISSKFQYWSADWASELGIPWYQIFPSPVFALACLQFPKIHEAGIVHGSSGVFADVPNVVPAPIMSLIRMSDLSRNLMLSPEVMANISDRMKRAAAIVVNFSEELDPGAETINGLRSALPSKVLAIGPILQFPGFGFNLSDSVDSTGLDWLDSQLEKSVLYVAFGTIATPPNSMILDIATGIETSGVPFLWVLQLGTRQLSEVLPPGFVDRTQGRGKIEITYVPQTEILSHRSIGGFLSHGGWNSLLEAVCAGVPVLVWPMGGDQFMNVRYMMDLAKIGYSISDFKADNKQSFQDIGSREVERAVRYMMLEDKGEDLVHRNLKSMQKGMQADVAEGGSSNRNLHDFLDLIGKP